MAWSTTRRDDSARRRREILIYAQHLAEDHRVRAAPHRHATRADVAAARTEAGRELALLVGRRRGDFRDEGLGAFHRLGGDRRRLRFGGGRVAAGARRRASGARELVGVGYISNSKGFSIVLNRRRRMALSPTIVALRQTR